MNVANRMVLKGTVFGSRSSEKIINMINQENFTAFILTKEFFTKKACIFQKK